MLDAANESALALCPLFTNLGPAELARVAEVSRALAVRAGDLVFREGQACEGFYVVVQGGVRLYKLAPDGRERTLHIARPPYAFAEAVTFGTGAYPAFAAATEESRLILVRRLPFLRMLEDQPDVAVRLLGSLSTWMHRLLDQLDAETFLNARAKLASYLLREARRQSHDQTPSRIVELEQTKKDVAAQLAMAPETLSRALAYLEGNGLIRSAGRRIEILDAPGLDDLLWGGGPGR